MNGGTCQYKTKLSGKMKVKKEEREGGKMGNECRKRLSKGGRKGDGRKDGRERRIARKNVYGGKVMGSYGRSAIMR